ncbi:probable Hsp70-Hsp90 organizing protein 1 at N-terminal half [Coccomyxa sp. Obi]|nr:probable Hsp70-Hsp90 organizing protein 1 at N-terminal half [Coccomyxa sp. Obi]
MQCKNCGGYWKATADYTVSTKDRGRRKHPGNDLSIIDCSRCGCPPAAHEALVAENEREAGNDAYALGQFPTAVAHYSRALAEQPHSAVLLSNRAAAYLAMRWFAQAEADAQKAVALRPDWPKAHARLGAAKLGLRKFSQAIACYERCSALAPASKEYAAALKSAQATAAKFGNDSVETKSVPPVDRLQPDALSEQNSSDAAGDRHVHDTQQTSEISSNEITEGAAADLGTSKNEAQADPASKHRITQESQDSEAVRQQGGPKREGSVSGQETVCESTLEGEDAERLKAEVAALRQEKVALGEAVQELRRQLADLTKENKSSINKGCKQHCCTCKGPLNGRPGDNMQDESSCSDRHDRASEQSRGSSNGAEPVQQPSRLSVEEQERLERIAAAQQRVADAESLRDLLQRTRCDGITQAVRSACNSCRKCAGFEIWFRAADANDPSVMLFCSEWKAEEERRRRHEEAARSARAERGRAASFSEEAAAREAAAALRVDMNASERQIRRVSLFIVEHERAWRKAALQLHPDKNKGRTEPFLKITQACNVLLNKT